MGEYRVKLTEGICICGCKGSLGASYKNFECVLCGGTAVVDGAFYFTTEELELWAAGAPVVHSQFEFSCTSLSQLAWGLCTDYLGFDTIAAVRAHCPGGPGHGP